MRTIRLLLTGAATAALMLGSTTLAMGQEETTLEGPSPYFYGEVEGFLHHDMENPLDCAIGFTSDSTLTGESTLLGATTVRLVNCYVPTDTLSNAQGGVLTFTGENGDTITASGGTGDCIPDWVAEPGGLWTCPFTTFVTGGTGAFEGATGEIHGISYVENVHEDADIKEGADAPGSITFEGLVEY
jgi:hypothetical protein